MGEVLEQERYHCTNFSSQAVSDQGDVVGHREGPSHRAVLPDTELLPELEPLEPRSS